MAPLNAACSPMIALVRRKVSRCTFFGWTSVRANSKPLRSGEAAANVGLKLSEGEGRGAACCDLSPVLVSCVTTSSRIQINTFLPSTLHADIEGMLLWDIRLRNGLQLRMPDS